MGTRCINSDLGLTCPQTYVSEGYAKCSSLPLITTRRSTRLSSCPSPSHRPLGMYKAMLGAPRGRQLGRYWREAGLRYLGRVTKGKSDFQRCWRDGATRRTLVPKRKALKSSSSSSHRVHVSSHPTLYPSSPSYSPSPTSLDAFLELGEEPHSELSRFT